MIRENWIDFACFLAVLGLGLVIGFVGCQRSNYPREAKPDELKPNSHTVVYDDSAR